MQGFWRDFGYAARIVRRTGGSSFAVILILALGIGTSTAVASIVDSILFRAVPYPDPERLYAISLIASEPGGRVATTSPSLEEVRQWRSSTSVARIAAWRFGTAVTVEDGSHLERIEPLHVRQVTQAYFELLGIRPHLGRSFAAGDVAGDASHVVLLGNAYWRGRYGSDPAVIGRVIQIQGEPTEIVGVLPPGFFQGERERLVHFWTPLRLSSADRFERDTRLHVEARLREGVAVAAAADELEELTRRLVTEGGGLTAARVDLTSFVEAARLHVNFWNVRILWAAGVAILVLACTNVVSVLLTRGASRVQELSVRASLGASHHALFRQVFAESVLLSIMAGAVAMPVAWLCLELIMGNTAGMVPVNVHPTLDTRTVLSGVAVTIAVCAAIGWLPALRQSRARGSDLVRPAVVLAGVLSARRSKVLIGIQVGVAVALLNCAGLLVRTVHALTTIEPGFDAGAVLVDVSPLNEGDRRNATEYFPALLTQIRAQPWVEAAGAVDRIGAGRIRQSASAIGRTVPVSVRRVVPGYFEALGVPLRQGSLPDARAPLPTGAVISEGLARRLFEDGSALGAVLGLNGTAIEIRAIVADVNHGAPRGSTQDEVYLTSTRTYVANPTLVIRPRITAPEVANELQRLAAGFSPRLLIEDVRTVRDEMWSFEAVGVKSQQARLLSALSGAAVLLATIGVFGATATATARRAREIGVRLALGETPSRAVRRVVGATMEAVFGGVLLGAVATIPASGLVAGLLVGTSRFDPFTLVAVACAISALALIAAWLAARPLSRMDPATILRAQ
jgi:predicted permease